MNGFMNLAKISTKVTFWPRQQEDEEQQQLNSLVNRLRPREAGKIIMTQKKTRPFNMTRVDVGSASLLLLTS